METERANSYPLMYVCWDEVDPEFRLSPRPGVDTEHVLKDLVPLGGQYKTFVMVTPNRVPKRAARWPLELVSGGHRRMADGFHTIKGREMLVVPCEEAPFEALKENIPDTKPLGPSDAHDHYLKHIRPLMLAQPLNHKLSVVAVARRLGVRPERVRSWAEEEQNKEANLARGRRAQEKISLEDLNAAYERELEMGRSPIQARKNLAARTGTCERNVTLRLNGYWVHEHKENHAMRYSMGSAAPAASATSKGSPEEAEAWVRFHEEQAELWQREFVSRCVAAREAELDREEQAG